MAAYFGAFLRSDPVMPAGEDVPIANIAKLPSTPLLRNQHSLAVGVLFEAIREHRRARGLTASQAEGGVGEKATPSIPGKPTRDPEQNGHASVQRETRAANL
jgi:hypothetical protein